MTQRVTQKTNHKNHAPNPPASEAGEHADCEEEEEEAEEDEELLMSKFRTFSSWWCRTSDSKLEKFI